jgi:hypothetical protein
VHLHFTTATAMAVAEGVDYSLFAGLVWAHLILDCPLSLPIHRVPLRAAQNNPARSLELRRPSVQLGLPTSTCYEASRSSLPLFC